MRLSKLKLSGFKTFVDPTTVDFPSNLVGVVGPNGCGKSNVIDAVRWVLGETRASALRGESMQDVIFNGSTTRKPVSRASVELVFDNESGRAAGQWSQYAEISVKRVLDRTGDSSYYLNGTHVRRKDVIDLFLGTGLGPRAYAIIEQGMISRIIEAKPEEIRGFIEEAAGVTKYRERRKETEGRLSDANENLLRLEDIRMELGERVERLAAQAEIAQRFKVLEASHQEKQQLLWLLKRNEALSEFNGISQQLATFSQQIETDNAQLQILEQTIESARQSHFQASEQAHQAQSDFFAAGAEVSRLETELKHITENRLRLETRLEQLTVEAQTWQQREAAREEDASRWTALLENAQQRVMQSEARHEEVAARLPERENARQTAETTVHAARRELAQSEQQMRVEETKRNSAIRALEALAIRRTRLEAERAAIVPPDPLLVAQAETRIEHLTQEQEAAQQQLQSLQAQFPAAQQALKAALEAERQATRTLTELRATREALAQLQSRVMAQGELGQWLAQHGLKDLPTLWQGLRVLPGWERAVEAVLQERLTALLDTGHAAATLINTPPPVTLSVLLEGAPAPTQAAEWAQLPSLLTYVEILDPRLIPALQTWLSPVFIAPNLLDWLPRRTQLPPGVMLVSQDGQCLSAHHISHYAPQARTHGVMERQREIEALTARQEALEIEQARAKEQAESAENQASTLQEDMNTQRQKVQTLQTRLHGEEVETLKLVQAQQRAEERHAQLARDIADLQHNESTEQAHQAQADREFERITDLVERQRARQESATEILNDQETALRETRTLEQTLAREVQEAKFSERECATKLVEIQNNRTLAAEQNQRIMTEHQAAEAELVSLETTLAKATLQQALEIRSSREAALGARKDALSAAAQHLKESEETRLKLEHSAAPVRTKVADLRLAAQAAELAIAQFETRLQEVSADETLLAPQLTPGLKENTLQREVSRLAKEMSELGPVNLAAVGELNEASERKGYLDAQHEDLTQAIATLEDAIRRIDRETREQLQQTYDVVSQHFSTLFPQLFGGGQAKLLLTGEEILDAGIQIVAQPPGKKNSSIHLLSGGEKALTAIALVFAFFQLNPAPFCMLDEVDAPLDDTNTERYGNMVKRMASQTQFIFISHSKITMEIAQQLVGVTMQEQGVSRVVEVDMEEALKLATTTPA